MRTPEGKAKVDAARRRGDVHLLFCVTLSRKQMEGGRCFVYEHPKSAASWANPNIEKLAATEGVMRTDLDQCEFGLMSQDELGRASAKKPTSAYELRGSRSSHGGQMQRRTSSCSFDGKSRSSSSPLSREVLQGHMQRDEEASQGRRQRHGFDADQRSRIGLRR